MKGLLSLEDGLKRNIIDYIFLTVFAGLIIIADQVTKTLVRTRLPVQGVWSPWPWLEPYARIVHWYNTGVAFGMFQGMNGVFIVLAFLVSLAIVYYYPRVPRKDWALHLAMGMQLAGAVGNLIDRVVYHQVTDFISIGNFAVFNVADASISVGVAILVLDVWIQDTKKKKETTAVERPGLPVEKNSPGEEETK
jgi:signal peptidase II